MRERRRRGRDRRHHAAGAVERDPIVRAKLPLLAKVLPLVGHAPTRARGTVGGSIANADPAAEIPLVAVTLGAALRYRDGAGTTDDRGVAISSSGR